MCDKSFGLKAIAEHFGKTTALELFNDGGGLESGGDVDGAIRLYKKAFRMWPELDSVLDGGIPRGVRRQVEGAGDGTLWFPGMIHAVDVTLARRSAVMRRPQLLTASDLQEVEGVLAAVRERDGSALGNNPQNATHSNKVCTMLNNPPQYRSVRIKPSDSRLCSLFMAFIACM
jgi:hypothetical protein